MQKANNISVRIASILHLLTAAVHSIGFFISTTPSNETEKQFPDYHGYYSMDLGD
jgi:hypothetical protein